MIAHICFSWGDMGLDVSGVMARALELFSGAVRELRPDLCVADVIYNPRQTKLLLDAKQRGCKTCNGLHMLLYQGAEAFRLWTGREMPVEVVRERIWGEK